MNIYKRFKTKEIYIGNLPLGGVHPIRVQSMTNTNTLDTDATVKQSVALIESGCEYVRITAPGKKEAENLMIIKKHIRQHGYNTPIIADVHFNPEIAEYCARFVEKVRINPGNYADKKSFKKLEYSDNEYFAELERISQRIKPLINICREYGTVLRIGTNHGSLSDRIINRYGDTPKGMVESTMEFLRICNYLGFSNIVVSLKASNPIVMIEANKLLVQQMIEENLCLPIHLGVTEAGQGEDGRIKSALGIGTLLNEGIGDTIRVSLTESPVMEIPFAKQLVKKYNEVPAYTFFEKYEPSDALIVPDFKKEVVDDRPFPYIIAHLKDNDEKTRAAVFTFNETNKCFEKHPTSPDAIHFEKTNLVFNFDSSVECIFNIKDFNNSTDGRNAVFASTGESVPEKHRTVFLKASLDEIDTILLNKSPILKKDIFLIIDEKASHQLIEKISDLHLKFKLAGINIPLLCSVKYDSTAPEQWLTESSVTYGRLLLAKYIFGLYVNAEAPHMPTALNALFGIMQAARVRISKTEYISCPTCGRTSFDMEATLKTIKEATYHLPGLKIGVMGCIVNGPGEMADADYGYVGNANGKVNLYKGRVAVKKNVNQEDALCELIELLKEDGKWHEKE